MRTLGILAALAAAAVGIGGTTAESADGDQVDFRFDILPLLHQSGCASAYCHGSATGRGGFKLSLFASDPRSDYEAIVDDRGGRRLDFVAPEHSLLLRKPTREIPHGGGRRMRVGDPIHRRLQSWIRDGAPLQGRSTLQLQRLRAERGDGDRMRVFARFRTGSGESEETIERDVTDLCTFSSTDPTVVHVDRRGHLHPRGPGEARVFARYDSRQTWLVVIREFAARVAPPPPADATTGLDAIWHRRLARLGLAPAPPAPSWQLARRLYLDLAGRLPTPDEQRRWNRLPAGERVAKTAALLVDAPAFATVFGRHLAQWFEIPLRPPARKNPQTAMFADVHRGLVQDLARGADAATIARRLLAEDPRLLHRFADPRDRAELAGRAFLGIRIGCARCHNSPVDRWEQADHLGFAALFASPRPAPGGGTRPGILFGPDGDPVPPRVLPLATEAPPASNPATPLAQRAADFILDGSRGQFARNIANRMFATLVGRGLVEPLDDHRPSNPAVHPEILDALAARFPTGDLRGLAMQIVTARIYQADSARPATGATGDARVDQARVRFFARREARPLSPHAFVRAIEQALDVKLSIQLPESPLARQLALLNGEVLHGAIASSPALSTLDQLVDSPATLARDLFLLLLSRPPRADELQLLSGQPPSAPRLAFALLASREFGSRR